MFQSDEIDPRLEEAFFQTEDTKGQENRVGYLPLSTFLFLVSLFIFLNDDMYSIEHTMSMHNTQGVLVLTPNYIRMLHGKESI